MKRMMCGLLCVMLLGCSKKITLEEAKKIALMEVSGVIIESYDKDYYEFLIEKDNVIYDISISKEGILISKDILSDRKDDMPIIPENNGILSKEQVQNIALHEIGGGNVVRCFFDNEDGIEVYEIEIYHKGIEYDLVIEAKSGEIISYYEDYHQ